MKLRGIEFGHVFNSSGARGFFGEGWWFHYLWKILFFFGFKPENLTFKSKTATWESRVGNMPKGRWAWIKRFFPACVIVKLWQKAVLNAVGLTNIGLLALLEKNRWQKRKDPFAISVMVMGKTKKEKLEEMAKIVKAIKRFILDAIPEIKVALEINVSCPNTGEDPKLLTNEVIEYLKTASKLGIPVMVKLNVFASLETVREIQDSGLCDAVVVTNTLPWWSFPRLIPWVKIFGGQTSPLKKRGFESAGGLSGPWVFPFLVDWIYRMRAAGITMPIIAGGGIIRKQDCLLLKLAGANAVEFSVGHFMFRPWAMESDRKYAESIFSQDQ